MIIKTLKLKNYRCFTDFDVEFDENIITFVGKNGTGKSCIFDGILYALFGFGQSNNRGGKSLIPNSTKPGEICEIEMIFALDDVDYKVVRRIKGKNFDVDAFLYKGDNPDVPIAERDSGVNKAIEQLLGMDYGTFKMSVFSSQKELSVFTDLTPEDRKKEIRKLLNLEVIKEAIRLAREDVKKFKIQIETWEAQSANLDELNSRLSELKTKNGVLEKEIVTLQIEYKKILQNLTSSKEEVELKTKIRDKVIQLQSRIKENNALLAEVKIQVEKDKERLQILQKKEEELKTIDEHKEKYLQAEKELGVQNESKTKFEKKILLDGEIKKLRLEYTSLSQTGKDIEKELLEYKEISSEKVKLQEQKLSIEQEQKESNREYTTIVANITNTNKELNDLKEKLTQLKNLGHDSVCPDCERKLGDHLDVLVNKYYLNIEACSKQIKKLEDQKIQATNTIAKTDLKKKELISLEENFQKRLSHFTQLKTNLSNNKENLTKTAKNGIVISDQIKDFGEFSFNPAQYEIIKRKFEEEKKIWDRIIVLEVEIKTIPNIKTELENQSKKIAQVNQINKRFTMEVKDIKFDEEEYQKLKIVLTQNEKDEQVKRQAIHEGEVKKVSNDKDTQAVEKDIEMQKKFKKNIEDTKKKITNLESLMVILDDFEANLLVRVRPMIEERASELLNVTTKGKYSTLELDQNYEPILHDLKNRYELSRFSGGEQDLVNLCLRIAISDIVAQRSGGKQISFLVLDEIFGSQDNERRLAIIETLQTLIGRFRQIFLITHEDIKESMPIVYEVKENERGNSQVTLVN